MLNLKELKNNKEYYLESFKNKGSDVKNELEEVLVLYDEYLNVLSLEQEARSQLNQISNDIKQDSSNQELKVKAGEISSTAKQYTIRATELIEKINEIVSYFPNPAADDVPIGKDEDDNVVLSTHLDELKENKFAKPHWEIIEEKNLILGEEASFISGTRHVIYNDKAALVIKALERFMLEEHDSNGYTIIEPPVIVNKEALFNTAQLPKFEEDLYKLEDGQYLIPTAEVPLTNLVANKILDVNELPLKFSAGTQCFRKEAGSAGKDTRGIIRLHQFRKVELVKIGKKENELADFNEMLTRVGGILEKLELPYRQLQLCTGDASFASRKTIDFEVWMPGVNMYREISSVSSVGDFQARRMKTRFTNEQGEKELVYTYNGSGLAIGRTFAAIVENNIGENGMIKVPTALRKYVNFDEF